MTQSATVILSRALGFAVLLSMIPCAADVLHLRDGTQLEGTIVSETKKTLTIQLDPVTAKVVPRNEIDWIERQKIPRDRLEALEEEYRKKLLEKSPQSATEHLELARWAHDAGLRHQAAVHFSEVLRLSSGHSESIVALRQMGFRRSEDRWLDQEMHLAEQGWESSLGLWLSKAEIALRRDLGKLIRTRNTLRAKRNVKDREVQDLGDLLLSLQRQERDLEQSIGKLEMSSEAASQAVRTAEAEFRAADSEHTAARRQNERVTRRLREVEQTHQRERLFLEPCQCAIEALRHEAAMATAQEGRAYHEREARRRVLEGVLPELASAEGELSRTRKRLPEVQHELDQARETRRKAEETLGEMARQLFEISQRIWTIEPQVDAQASLSAQRQAEWNLLGN